MFLEFLQFLERMCEIESGWAVFVVTRREKHWVKFKKNETWTWPVIQLQQRPHQPHQELRTLKADGSSRIAYGGSRKDEVDNNIILSLPFSFYPRSKHLYPSLPPAGPSRALWLAAHRETCCFSSEVLSLRHLALRPASRCGVRRWWWWWWWWCTCTTLAERPSWRGGQVIRGTLSHE